MRDLARIATSLCIAAITVAVFVRAQSGGEFASYALAALLLVGFHAFLIVTSGRHDAATDNVKQADSGPALARPESEGTQPNPAGKAGVTDAEGLQNEEPTVAPYKEANGVLPTSADKTLQATSIEHDVPTQAEETSSGTLAHQGADDRTDETAAKLTDGPVPDTTPSTAPRPTVTHDDGQDEMSYDFEAFRRALLLSRNPIATLREMVSGIARRQREGAVVLGVEAFLTRQLTEAGLMEDPHSELAGMSVAWPHRSNTFYLRPPSDRLTYGSAIFLLTVEAVLVAINTAHEYYAEELDRVSEEDLLRLWQRTRNSLCAQVPDVDTADWSYLAMPWQIPFGPADQGEWSVRESVAEAIETAQVPYRLEARFRCNVAEGDVAIEFAATPHRALPKSAYVDGLGIMPTTPAARRREASCYAARIGILLANHAFRASTKIRRVWVAAIRHTPSTQQCLYSVCIGRRAFSHVRMSAQRDPLATLQSLGASMTLADGSLMPCEPLFYLEDERFCPARRHDLWQLSERTLSTQASRSLGASRVSGLLIHEELPLALAADEMLRGLAEPQTPGATEKSVHAILSVARKTSDINVWSAADRVVAKLVDGRLGTDDPYAVREELVEGDPLSQAVHRAQLQLMDEEPQEALRTLNSALDPLERSGTYDDTPAIAYRNFDNFAERVLYNRINEDDKRSIVLVPDTYLAAHLLSSAILTSLPNDMGGSKSEALRHATRAAQIAPYSVSASMTLSACLEATEDLEGATRELTRFLNIAHSPHGMGMAYFRLATIEAQLGDLRACRACFQRCVQLLPPLLPFVVAKYQELAANTDESTEILDDEELARELDKHGIPLAPTQQTAYILYDGATASVDAEVFPVALDLLQALVALTGDDVLRGIRASLEREPDA